MAAQARILPFLVTTVSVFVLQVIVKHIPQGQRVNDVDNAMPQKTVVTRRPPIPKAINPVIAVEVAGPARSLDRTVCSIREHIFRPAQAAGYDVHVFVATPNSDPQKEAYNTSFNQTTEVAGLHYLELPFPHSTASEHPRRCLQLFERIYDRKVQQGHGKAYVREWLAKWYYRWRVDEYRQLHALKAAIDFDWVIMLRPDALFVTPLQFSKLSVSQLHVPSFHSFKGYNDRFFVGSSNLLSTVFRFYVDACVKAKYNWTSSPSGWTSEQILSRYLREKNVSVRTLGDFYFFNQRFQLQGPMLAEVYGKYAIVSKPSRASVLYRKGQTLLQDCKNTVRNESASPQIS